MHGPELHITSLVVHAAPSRVAQVGAAIAELSGALVHAQTPSGKIVVTIEAESAAVITDLVSTIQRFDGVFSAALVYQCADSLEAMNEEVPDVEAGVH